MKTDVNFRFFISFSGRDPMFSGRMLFGTIPVAMKRIALLLLAAAATSAAAWDEIEKATAGWEVMPVPVVAGATDVLPKTGEWKPAAFSGPVPQAPGAKQGDLYGGEYNAWYRKAFFVPGEWSGRDLRLELNLNALDAVVFVNGERAGIIHHFHEDLEISRLLRCGATNEVEVFVTNGGFGTDEKPNAYHGRDEGRAAYGHLGIRAFGVDLPGCRFVARTPAWLEAPYANPSWRNRELVLSATVHSLAAREAEVSVEIAEACGEWEGVPASGKTVKTVREKVTLHPGENEVVLHIPWTDAKPWEPVKNAFLYECRVGLSAGGESCDAPKPFLFGFREIWTEGKEIYLNGHIQRFRGFWNQGEPKVLSDLHDYGYNLSYETHQHQGVWAEDPVRNEEYSKAGICRFTGLPSIYSLHGWTSLTEDDDCARQWRRHLKFWAESARNWPCIVAASCGVNQMCPTSNMQPPILAQSWSWGAPKVVADINFACEESRKVHSNCLYFSHADGTEKNADFSSSNLYFNFTPLQEREEWLSSWAEKGIRPWYAAEFDAPYYACWFHSRVPEMTEWLAVYYGERAYDEETEDLLSRLKAYAKDCQRLTHGGWVDRKDMYFYSPLAEEYSRMLVYRTNRAWRGFGQNGGMMYLTSWKWDEPNAMRDRQRLANGDLVTFLGGAPAFTDRTHAYRSGDKIEKTLVACWDGLGRTTVKASWRFVSAKDGRVVASGEETMELSQGDIRKRPVSVTAPDTKTRAEFRFEVSFDAKGIDESVKTDSFAVEVHPRASAPETVSHADWALYDPEGLSESTLAALGIACTKIDRLEDALENKKFTRLLVGRNTLSHATGLEKFSPRIAAGLKVLVFQQEPDTWAALGFHPEDCQARQMFNVALEGVDDADLHHWRGCPEGRGSGSVMRHRTRRGPRWKHTHSVSSTPLLIPNRGGFRPLVRGEFDLSYSALLEARYGKGSVLFCAFDFEGRVGAEGCPAATAVAEATMARFRAKDAETVEVQYGGEKAKRLVEALGLDAKEGRDKAKNWLRIGKTKIILGDAAAAGLSVVETNSLRRVNDRARLAETDAFKGVSGSLLRWRDDLPVERVAPKIRGWLSYADGAIAISADGRTILDMIDPFALCDRYRDSSDGQVADTAAAGGWGITPASEKDLYLRNAAQTEENDLRRWALVSANLGAGAGTDVLRRSLYLKPEGGIDALQGSHQFNVLGPWPCGKENPEAILNAIPRVRDDIQGDTGETAEQMARTGDVQPNPRFYPVGCEWKPETPKDLRFIDWRPTWHSNENGIMSIDWMNSTALFKTPCVWYAVAFLPREKDGYVALRFEAPTAGKVWVNGKEVCSSLNGETKTVEDIPVFARGHEGDGLFEGLNVIAVKVVTFEGSKRFRLQISGEPTGPAASYPRVRELDSVDLLRTANPYFDPYEYIYW